MFFHNENAQSKDQGFTQVPSKEPSQGILSYLDHVQNYFPIEGNPAETISFLGKKNTEEIIIEHKGTRMIEDGEDKRGL